MARQLPEKLKLSYAMYQSMLAEVEKLAYREGAKLTPEQAAHWRALQGGEAGGEIVGGSSAAASAPGRAYHEGVLTQPATRGEMGRVIPEGPTRTIPGPNIPQKSTWGAELAPSRTGEEFARQAVTHKTLEKVPLVGSHGEYYHEALPKHLHTAETLEGDVAAAKATAAKRQAFLSSRVSQQSGPQLSPPAGQQFTGELQMRRAPSPSATPARVGAAPAPTAGSVSESLKLQPPSQVSSLSTSQAGLRPPSSLIPAGPTDLTRPGTQLRGEITRPHTQVTKAAPVRAQLRSGVGFEPTQVGRITGSEATQVAARPSPGALKPPPTLPRPTPTPIAPLAKKVAPMGAVKPGFLSRAGAAVKGLGKKIIRAAA